MDGSWSHPGLREVQQAASRRTGHPLALNAPSTRTVNIRLYALQLYDMSYNWGIFLARGRTRTQHSSVCRRPSRHRAFHWSDPSDVAAQSATIQQHGQLNKCARVSYNRVLTVSVFGTFCLVPPSPLLRGGPGECQRRRPDVGSYQSFGLCPGGGVGKQGTVAGTAAGLLCARYIGLATQARWSSSQTTRLPQAQSQLH